MPATRSRYAGSLQQPALFVYRKRDAPNVANTRVFPAQLEMCRLFRSFGAEDPHLKLAFAPCLGWTRRSGSGAVLLSLRHAGSIPAAFLMEEKNEVSRDPHEAKLIQSPPLQRASKPKRSFGALNTIINQNCVWEMLVPCSEKLGRSHHFKEASNFACNMHFRFFTLKNKPVAVQISFFLTLQYELSNCAKLFL